VPEDLQAFAAAVARVLEDATLQSQLGATGRRYARGWSALAMAQRLAGLYRELREGSRTCADARACIATPSARGDTSVVRSGDA